jgi:hypothetical protein
MGKTGQVTHMYECSIVARGRNVPQCIHLLEVVHAVKGEGGSGLLSGCWPPLHPHELPPLVWSSTGTPAEIYPNTVHAVHMYNHKIARS